MKLKRVAYTVLLVVFVWILVGFLATSPVVGNHPFWRQLRARPIDFGLHAETVSFLSQDGITLYAWYIPTQGPALGTIILAHGIDGNRSDMLPRAWFLSRDHYNTLLVDLRAHGQSGGDYATPGYMESRDVLGALSYLRHSRHITGPIVAFGHSYGAVACLYAAAESPDIAAVIADGAFISFENMMKRATILLAEDPERSRVDRVGLRLAGSTAAEWVVLPMYYLRTGVWPSAAKSDVFRAIPHIDRPILFIAGQNDEICPPVNTQLMYDAATNPKKGLLVVRSAGHDSTYATNPQEYEATVLAFLHRALT